MVLNRAVLRAPSCYSMYNVNKRERKALSKYSHAFGSLKLQEIFIKHTEEVFHLATQSLDFFRQLTCDESYGITL